MVLGEPEERQPWTSGPFSMFGLKCTFVATLYASGEVLIRLKASRELLEFLAKETDVEE